ncbi:hypothetical protein J1605_004701 [Eschrichtius robustus]|uniref:Uncharacterized protein n=1 Tax=Eschrichtius robustus TaxID=9764 RepID=A0AB34HDG4_ESCRO|nr:hypothetical protein J1605_004701 [Eschrichtius robustus]
MGLGYHSRSCSGQKSNPVSIYEILSASVLDAPGFNSRLFPGTFVKFFEAYIFQTLAAYVFFSQGSPATEVKCMAQQHSRCRSRDSRPETPDQGLRIQDKAELCYASTRPGCEGNPGSQCPGRIRSPWGHMEHPSEWSQS